MTDDYKKEGFWYSQYEPHFPMPVHCDEPHHLKNTILEKYDALLKQDIFNPNFNTNESIDWDEIHKHVVCYRGFSYCRICNEEKQYDSKKGIILLDMGSREYRHNGWTWPQGYRHYIDEHNIVPTKKFLKDVLGMEI